MTITLYGPRTSPFTEKVVRALALKRLAFELCEPTSPEDYRRWNPRTGLLPVIDIDGERVADSTTILLRLDERFPEPPLLARDLRTAAAQLRLVSWVDESFFWYWMRWQRIRSDERPSGAPFVNHAGEDEGEPPVESPRPSGVSLRSWLVRRERRRPEVRETEVARIAHEIGRRLDDLARLLADRRYFYADRISMADLAVYAMLRGIAEGGISGSRVHLDRYPALLEFLKRVEQETGG